jgi:diadenosine tetraphosphate (Ap4A) HIT family hydrolase
MVGSDCIFCSIVAGKIPSYKIYEDENHIAFLDIFPNIRGQTLVVSKKHFSSNAFDLDPEALADFIKSTQKVAKLLEAKLKVGRVHLVLEGTGINHLHAKLYPAIGIIGKEFNEHVANEKRHFDHYEGYITTLMGPKADDKELAELQKLLSS